MTKNKNIMITKSQNINAIYITMICVLLLSTGQAFIKFGFSNCIKFEQIEMNPSFFLNFFNSFISTPYILIGYGLAGTSSIIFLEALHKAEFGVTNAVLRLNYILSYLIGVLYFQEIFKPINFIGVLLIFSGVVFISINKY